MDSSDNYVDLWCGLRAPDYIFTYHLCKWRIMSQKEAFILNWHNSKNTMTSFSSFE